MAVSKQQNKALVTVNYDLFRLVDRPAPAPATLYTKIQLHAERAVTATPSESIRLSSTGLPEAAELYRLFDQYNRAHFNGKLPRVRIEYSERMSSAGSYLPDRRLIRIGRRYHEIFPEEVTDTLRHEMIHILHLNHDAAFKSVAGRIGASVKARSHPSLRRPPRYVYVCRACGRQFARQRRIRMASCGYCTPGREFDPRFKLIKLKSAARSSG
ncbi:MAG TPA: SprT-like domain-containing protein [Candidatus Deferrimicrobium sp.]|nr:SprT-like domain-containing protein [Candidatus Deferrimicrobium sp.]